MIPFVTLIDTRSQKIAVNAKVVQLVKAFDNAPDECLVVIGKDQRSACAECWWKRRGFE
jgi:hypothetical protein